MFILSISIPPKIHIDSSIIRGTEYGDVIDCSYTDRCSNNPSCKQKQYVKPQNSHGTEKNLVHIFTTFASTYLDAKHVSIGLVPAHSLLFSLNFALPFLISTPHVRDQSPNVHFSSALPLRLHVSLYNTPTMTTYKEVLFI